MYMVKRPKSTLTNGGTLILYLYNMYVCMYINYKSYTQFVLTQKPKTRNCCTLSFRFIYYKTNDLENLLRGFTLAKLYHEYVYMYIQYANIL